VIGSMSFAGSLAGAAILAVVVARSGTSTTDPAPYRTVLWLTPVAFLACAGAMLAAKPAPRALPDLASCGGTPPFGLLPCSE
jgi:hypothetical protein